MLAQEDDEKNERARYHLSKRFHNSENRYTHIEKSCYAFGRVEIETYHFILPNMGGGKNGPIKVPL